MWDKLPSHDVKLLVGKSLLFSELSYMSTQFTSLYGSSSSIATVNSYRERRTSHFAFDVAHDILSLWGFNHDWMALGSPRLKSFPHLWRISQILHIQYVSRIAVTRGKSIDCLFDLKRGRFLDLTFHFTILPHEILVWTMCFAGACQSIH